MKYTKNERLEIGRRIYSGEISRFQAAEEYGISEYAARDYMRLYRDVNNLPPKRASSKSLPEAVSVRQVETLPSLEDYQSMSKEELIARGVNFSVSHNDFMIGTDDIKVVGTTHDGKEVTIMEHGDFVI